MGFEALVGRWLVESYDLSDVRCEFIEPPNRHSRSRRDTRRGLLRRILWAPRRDSLYCVLSFRGKAIDLRQSGCDPFNPLYDCRFGLYADNAIQLSPAFKQK
jgi:hypothetical protein